MVAIVSKTGMVMVLFLFFPAVYASQEGKKGISITKKSINTAKIKLEVVKSSSLNKNYLHLDVEPFISAKTLKEIIQNESGNTPIKIGINKPGADKETFVWISEEGRVELRSEGAKAIVFPLSEHVAALGFNHVLSMTTTIKDMQARARWQ